MKPEASRQICITTDNGSNITCATTTTLSWIKLPCFRHCLHLAVVNSTKDDPRVQRAIGLCVYILSQLEEKTLAQSDLGHGLPQHLVVADCVTRWAT